MHARQAVCFCAITSHLLVYLYVHALCVGMWVHLCYCRHMWRSEDNLRYWSCTFCYMASGLSSFQRFCVCFLCPHRSAAYDHGQSHYVLGFFYVTSEDSQLGPHACILQIIFIF